MDKRRATLQQLLTKEMLGIEIGALHTPTVPKRDGWNVISVDHDTTEGLTRAYKGDPNVVAESLQPVDVVWNHGLISDALKHSGYGERHFDYIVASHVIEHFPNLLGTLRDFELMMRDEGVLVLAVPDMRYCFDFFMPMSSTAEVLTAHHRKRSRHTRESFFRMAAYDVLNRDTNLSGWADGNVKNFRFLSNLHHAYDRFVQHDESNDAKYIDNHTWYFTPSSFSLIMLELRALDLIAFEIVLKEPGPHGEFLVSLRKRAEPLLLSEDELNNHRMALLRSSVVELAQRAVMLGLMEKPAQFPEAARSCVSSDPPLAFH
ncbi:hypothetical protein LMG28140_01618 [Paraburkholderia metrosideri]|uniref:Methyltransferase domain-containing protein n=2 Tax=Paraburkholderia metrosideri TaxID=580937 RepID=A0ABN7HKG8_9BURK|nr:hypothetical protein LMG28140_01618 [Paraburkholderia metrosideri]